MASLLDYSVAILGCPCRPDVDWNQENLIRLKNLGFNTMQLNIAWGARPGDEPLNLEDVVSLPQETLDALAQTDSTPRSDQSPPAIARREADLRHRIRLCKDLGFHTIFHFGAPYNLQYSGTIDINGKQPRCLMDPNTTEYYVRLMHAFATKYGVVDDLLVYTYDQDAWLCNEFGTCELCRGIPLHKRVVPFINQLATTWRKINPQGRLWWSPWELSSGQVVECVELLQTEGMGLDLHPNIAETIATIPVDRWLKNVSRLAMERGIPVIVEGYWNAPTEELEPFHYLAHPHVVYRQFKAISATPGVHGIKEYYGLIPTKEDPNLRMTGICLKDPSVSEETALARLAEPYGTAAKDVLEYWRLCSLAQEVFPWDTSWFLREIGRSDVSHSLSAGFVRGQQVSTPAWDSSRRTIFMKTDSVQPHPWLLEDVQLRVEQAARRYEQALEVGTRALPLVPASLAYDFEQSLKESAAFRRRALAYAYHLRETNLVGIFRGWLKEGKSIPAEQLSEMESVLEKDLANQREDQVHAQGMTLAGCQWIWFPEPPPTWVYSTFMPRYFRRSFEIPSGKKVTRAWFLGAPTESVLNLFLNGKKVGVDAAYLRPFFLDLTQSVVEGKNTLAMRVPKGTSEGPRPALVGQLRIDFSDGSSSTIRTDNQWLACNEEREGWTQLDYNDSEWLPTEQLGEYGCDPWGTKGFGDGGAAISKAIDLFRTDLKAFLDTYFQEVPDQVSRGVFTMTSR
jgi:hypothetical protein